MHYGPARQEMGNLKFRKSIFVSEDIREGETLTERNIRVIRPAHGLEPKYYWEVLGKKAKKDLHRGNPLRMDEVV